jgi:hypothetical protein
VYSGNLAGATALAQLAIEPERASEVRALGHIQLAHLALVGGRWRQAMQEVAAAETIDRARALPVRAWMLSLPFVTPPRAELEAARDALASWDAAAVPPSQSRSLFLRAHDGVHAALRLYGLALLTSRLGDNAAAHRHAIELAGLGGGRRERALARALSDGALARIASTRGERSAARTTLAHAMLQAPYDDPIASPFFSQSLERFLLAGLLAEQGRTEEALRWYSSFSGISVYDLVFLAPAHRERGRLLDSLGRQAEADVHYARAAELWAESDEELARPSERPLTEVAPTHVGPAMGIA